MTINTDDKYKVQFVKLLGPNKLFADFDYEDRVLRKALSDADAIHLFDRAWQYHRLDTHITNAEGIDAEKANDRLTESAKKYLRRDQEQREFRHQILELEFIAQLNPLNDGYQLTQLWQVNSRDLHPNMLPVWFESANQKKQFDALAQMLGNHNGSELAKKLLLEFMAKFPEQMLEQALQHAKR